MDAIPWPVVGPATGWAAFILLSLYVVRAIISGALVPRKTHEEKEHEANEWRTEGRIKDQAIIATLDDIRADVAEQGKTLHTFIEALQRTADVRPRDKGGS